MHELFLLKSTRSSVAQDGGFVSMMLGWLLENEIITGAYVVARDGVWNSAYTFISSAQESVQSAGSKYLKHKPPWKQMESQSGLIGFVGTPCLIEIYQRKYDRGQVPGSIRFALICHGSFEPELLDEISKRIHPTTLVELNRMDFVSRNLEGKRRVVLEVKAENIAIDLPLEDIRQYKPKVCERCERISSQLADFVCGSGKIVALEGYTVVACMTPRASDYCTRAIGDGWFHAKEVSADQLGKLKKVFRLV
jgi:coenzyme F420-reducing hydrogenase beta subunit